MLEAYNQTTQAPYCAAYLSILATMYGSFVPALSEHHAGGVNVGRAMINGERLGGVTTPERYLMGSQFARDLRGVALRRFRDLYRTYGVRSSLYAEMVFGNTVNVTRFAAEVPQVRIFAMRTPRPIPIAEIARRTGLAADEVRRYNPALTRQVPARANVYLPAYVPEFGPNVSFWHEPPSPAYRAALGEANRRRARCARAGGVHHFDAGLADVAQDLGADHPARLPDVSAIQRLHLLNRQAGVVEREQGCLGAQLFHRLLGEPAELDHADADREDLVAHGAPLG